MFSSFSTLTQALVNIFIFLPYYFSVDVLFHTLFEPWKRVVPTEKRVGFSFTDYFNDLAFEWVSRGIGFVIRTATILTYIVVQVLYVPFALLLVGVYAIVIFPILQLSKMFGKSESERLSDEKQAFIGSHTHDPNHVPEVEVWFDTWHAKQSHHSRWWELDNLFNTIPIGRNWAQGYTPILDQYVVDLSETASKYEDRPMTIGRESELKQIEDVLCKTNGANILMVGEEGVGKTTIIESLAYRIHIGRGNPLLSYKRLVEINLEKILATDRDPKVRETILEELFAEANRADNIIFVIYHFDKYMSSGESRVDLSTPLEKFLRSNRIHVIGTTTPFAYQKFLYSRQVLKNHFTILDVKEITPEVTFQILLEHTHRFEIRYKVSILYETLLAAVQKSAFFITDVPFPEKALLVIDECCNRAKDVEVAKGQIRIVGPEMVDSVLSERTHVPTTLTSTFKEKLLTIYDRLSESVVGQQHALGELSSALQRSFLLIGKRKKPLASFLFLGPTGVGKTETAKVLASEFFEGQSSIIRFDMSEFQQVSDIPKLIGSTETGEPGLLVSAIREKPYGVLLLDEIEKAHHDLLNIFLTLLDEGYITDSTGKHVDCKSLVVIGTSNAGALEFYNLANTANTSPSSESSTNPSEHSQISSSPESLTSYQPNIDIMSFLIEKRYFLPEFVNRFDGVIAFRPLTDETAFAIARRMVGQIGVNIQNLHNVSLVVSDSTIRDIIKHHFDTAYGARDLERALQEKVENVVAQKILGNEAKKGDTIEI